MRVTIYATLATLLAGCASETPKGVNTHDAQGACSPYIDTTTDHARVCAEGTNTWKRFHIIAEKHSYSTTTTATEILWAPPGELCARNPALLDIREVKNCERFGPTHN